MTIIKAEIPKELNDSLFAVAKFENQSVSSLVRDAIERYVREFEEDKMDADIALAVMKDKNMKCYSSEEMKERLEARCRVSK